MTRHPARSLAVDAWPPADRAAWQRALAPAESLFDEEGGAAERYSAAALRNFVAAYGLWLSYLGRTGQLDPAEAPTARATPGRLNGWVAEQRSRGNLASTIYGRLRDLHATLRLMAPEVELGFILRPGGRSLRRLLRPVSRHVAVRDPRELLACALALFEGGRAGQGYAQGRAAVRDAALLGLLAAHAPRIGSVARMEIVTHLAPVEGGYRIDFGERDTKTRKPLTYGLNPELVPVYDHYLRIVRPSLPRARHSGALWLGVTGGVMDKHSLAKVVGRRTQGWLGEAKGPHWFRKCLRSFASDVAPEMAFDAAMMLGHGPQVSLDHYAKATAAWALRRHGARVTKVRRSTWSLAASAYGWRDDDAALEAGVHGRDGRIMSHKTEGRR